MIAGGSSRYAKLNLGKVPWDAIVKLPTLLVGGPQKRKKILIESRCHKQISAAPGAWPMWAEIFTSAKAKRHFSYQLKNRIESNVWLIDKQGEETMTSMTGDSYLGTWLRFLGCKHCSRIQIENAYKRYSLFSPSKKWKRNAFTASPQV